MLHLKAPVLGSHDAHMLSTLVVIGFDRHTENSFVVRQLAFYLLKLDCIKYIYEAEIKSLLFKGTAPGKFLNLVLRDKKVNVKFCPQRRRG